MDENILNAARKFFNHYSIEDNRLDLIYEHNQYWIRFYDGHEEIDRTFSVVEAEGIGTINGFDFEEV